MFEGMPEPQRPPPNAGDLVAAWVDGWSASHGGRAPHDAVVRRVAGICRELGKQCESLESWRDAWHAASAAGARGRYDVIDVLAETTPLNAGQSLDDAARSFLEGLDR